MSAQPVNQPDHAISLGGAGDRPRATLLHNPNAGAGRIPREVLEQSLEDAGFIVAYGNIKSSGWEELLSQSADLLVVAGGDGTLAKVLPRLPGDAPPFTVFPLGSANNIATSLGITDGPAAVAASLSGAQTASFDVGLIEAPWAAKHFVEAVGFGALAASLASGGDGRIEGDKLEAGRRAFARALSGAKAWKGDLQVDNEIHHGTWVIVEVLNVGRTGPQVPLVPHANSGDGRFDCYLLADDERPAMLDWLESGGGNPAPGTRLRGADVSFDWDGSLPFRIDDELQDRPAHLTRIRLRPRLRQLRVLRPPSSGIENG